MKTGSSLLWLGLCLCAGVPSTHAQTYSRTEQIVYHDNLSKWVIGQVQSVTCQASTQAGCTGQVVSQTDYDATTALPLRSYRFGKLQQTLTYNADGTVATVKDGNNNVTTLANWYRGIPQSITYPGGATQSAAVNASGWITSVTDENGFTTGYGYDAMGRLASVVYPTADSTAWNTTTRVFQQVGSAEYGIPAGHWRQTITTGNAQKITYFDALWRPLVTREYDAANEAGTKRFQRFTYDHEGRTTFASYPGISDALSTGIWTNYDALGRPTSVSQDSEHGLLVSITEYLSGFKTRNTNPRGLQTTTAYQAYDQPTTDMPVAITHPEGAYTDIVRDAHGKPSLLVRRNASNSQRVERRYIYDTYQQLCKAIEPETGATVMEYDGNGNLGWSVSGLSLPGYGATDDCNRPDAWNTGLRVHRSYDTRNRLTNLNFPNGRGDQVWTYTLDGLPQQITTYNDPGNGAPVVNAYSYNKRRLLTGESSGQSGWYSWGSGYGYDANGNLSAQSYPTGLVVNYVPNALGQPTSVHDNGGNTYASGLSYYPNGGIQQFTYGNGLQHTMAQNARKLPLRVIDGGNALDHEYGYDANGNVSHVYDYIIGAPTAQHRYMEYDGLDRLTAVGSQMFGGDHWHRFTYDTLDNLKSWKLAGVKDHANYSYDVNNRLTSIQNTGGATTVGLSYDVQGNLSNKNGQGHGFDYGNRLREVTGKEYYRYDGHGRRVLNWRPDSTLTLSQYAQSGQLMYQENSSRQLAIEHVYLQGSLLALRERPYSSSTPVIKYQHTDALGSPVAMTNAAGTVVERTNYEPYGAAIGKTIDGVGYTGHVMDAVTGLTYMQQRYYDPQCGCFLSVDPVTAYSSGDMRFFNRYAYAFNNPYRFTDPDGRQSRDIENEYKVSGATPPSSDATFADAMQGIADFINPFMPAAGCSRDGCGAGGWTMAALGTLPQGKLANMGRFLKVSEFGKSIAGSLSKTSRQFQGQSIYLVTEKVENSVLKKGDQLYLDGKHKDHIEVFDSKGNARAVLNLDGTVNKAKTETAIERGRRLKEK